MLPSAEPRAQRLLLPPRCLLGGLPWCWRVRCAPWPHPYPVWGSQDRKCPLRVWPAIQPHSPRLGGAETACFYVLIPSLKCADTGLYVSRVLPHSIPVLWRPASLHPRSTSVHVGSRKLPQRPAPAVCLSGPLPLGWAAGRCCVVAGSQRRRGLPWPPQSGCWGEPARSLPAQSSPRGSRWPGQEVQGWSSGHFRWLPPQASS